MSYDKSLIVYNTLEGDIVFDLDVDKETIWATADQIADVFGVTKRNIVTHLTNIYKEKELDMERTWKENFQVQNEGGRQVRRKKSLYNLDAIISVGYRVNSKKATRFRVWATRVLKEYVTNGVAVNERRLKELSEQKLKQVETTLGLARRLMEKTELSEDETKGMLEVISRYGNTIETISEYEAKDVTVILNNSGRTRRELTIGDVVNLVDNLREEKGKGEGFGEPKELMGLEQFLNDLTRDRGALIEKAARLLYYMVREKPFKEGNREIGALVFVYYLTINDYLLSMNGETRLSDRALTALTLLVAESRKEEEDLTIGLITKLLD